MTRVWLASPAGAVSDALRYLERIIPGLPSTRPHAPREEAMKQLICLAAKACGVGTQQAILPDISTSTAGAIDRHPMRGGLIPEGRSRRRDTPIAKRLVSELVEEGRLVPARVEGWNPQAYLHPRARVTRAISARGLVTPFDSLVWERSRMERLFAMKYTIEMYVPAVKRVYGYYVCPFLLGDSLVARCDLKADRARRILMVQSAFLEPGQDARRVVPGLAEELRQMQTWLELDAIEVGPQGGLARMLRTNIRSK